MAKKKAANHREGLVQANTWIKPETRDFIKGLAKEEGRSYSKQTARLLDDLAESFKLPANN